MKKIICSIVLVLTLSIARVSAAGAMGSREAIKTVFGNSASARCIASRESTGVLGHYNPGAVSPTGDHGLFQINAVTWFGKVITFGHHRMRVVRRYIYNPLYNARVAFIISRGGRHWEPWRTHSLCGV